MNNKATTVNIAARYRKFDRPRNPERLSGSEKRFLLNYAYHMDIRAEKPAGRVLRGKPSNPTALH